MEIKINEIRLSLIWFAPFKGIIDDAAPMAFLSSRDDYIELFTKTQNNETSYSLPWGNGSGAHFWQHYFSQKDLANVSSRVAWQRIAPLCLTPMLSVERSKESACRISIDDFIYPHGIAVMLTLGLRGVFSLEDAVENLMLYRNDFQFKTHDSSNQIYDLNLNQIADMELSRLWKTVLGINTPKKMPPAEPFSLTTIIDGEADTTNVIIPENSETHRALEALCRFSVSWKENPLHPLDSNTCIDFKAKNYTPACNMIYGLKRARVLWFPEYFVKPDKKKRCTKLGCYHRNLSLASLQTESLINLTTLIYPHIENGSFIPEPSGGFSKKAAGLIGRIYGGVQDETYRSGSLRKQIDDSGMVNIINRVRESFPPMAKLN